MSPTHLMSLNPRISPSAARRIAAACGAGVLLLGAAACGSSNDPGNAANNTGENGGPQTSQNGTGGTGQFPGANGKVVAVADQTAQVQGNDGQVAVTWNGTTTFTKQVSAKLADVKVGSCVMVTSADDSGSSSGSGATTAPTAITASTVRITAKGTDGTCSAGVGGAGGGPQLNRNGGQPPAGGAEGGNPPSGGGNPPSGSGSGGSSGSTPRIRGFGGAFGEVTAVNASGFTVKSTVPQFGGGNTSSGSTPTTTTSTVTVTVTASTTYTTTGKGAATDVKVGSCLRAQGTTDSTGAVTAKTVELSPATNGECTVGFRRGDGPAGAGGAGTSTQEG